MDEVEHVRSRRVKITLDGSSESPLGEPFSHYSRTMDSDVIDWQGRQIVQSLLNLDDSLL